MKLNEDKKTVAAMDILVPKVGELIGGSEREYRYSCISHYGALLRVFALQVGRFGGSHSGTRIGLGGLQVVP